MIHPHRDVVFSNHLTFLAKHLLPGASRSRMSSGRVEDSLGRPKVEDGGAERLKFSRALI